MIGNASLLDRFTTHDGEWRSVPTISIQNETGTITKISIIALPGVGTEHIELVIKSPDANKEGLTLNATETFGGFGYEMVLEPPINLSDIASVWIKHPSYEDSGMRLLHQVGDERLNISWCWNRMNENVHNEIAYDYPLLAIETGNSCNDLAIIVCLSHYSRASRMY